MLNMGHLPLFLIPVGWALCTWHCAIGIKACSGSFIVPHAGALGIVCHSGGSGMARVAVGGHTHLMLGGCTCWDGGGGCGLRPVVLITPVMMREELPWGIAPAEYLWEAVCWALGIVPVWIRGCMVDGSLCLMPVRWVLGACCVLPCSWRCVFLNGGGRFMLVLVWWAPLCIATGLLELSFAISLIPWPMTGQLANTPSTSLNSQPPASFHFL